MGFRKKGARPGQGQPRDGIVAGGRPFARHNRGAGQAAPTATVYVVMGEVIQAPSHSSPLGGIAMPSVIPHVVSENVSEFGLDDGVMLDGLCNDNGAPDQVMNDQAAQPAVLPSFGSGGPDLVPAAPGMEPTSFKADMSDPEWRKAMANEIQALEDNDTWRMKSLPPGKKALGSRWV
ncbi:hypothetical protein LIER_36969 [Lithospermum erythrorhizon]|uniref:Uncharacterized protein n=1 Tax=Lithospermum erythrorhizon TaxID=34254 RepID=A0AAV3PFA0_LITER